MGKIFVKHLDGRVYSCKLCSTNLAQFDCLISKQFHCRHGRAYLFDHVSNICLGAFEERIMTTGKHTVCDICCSNCLQIVGWKYEKAFERSQKYKEGKFILERAAICDSTEQHGDDDHDLSPALHPESTPTLNPEIPSGLVQAMNNINRPMVYALGSGSGSGSSGSDDLSMRTFRQLRGTIAARGQHSLEESESTPISFRSDD